MASPDTAGSGALAPVTLGVLIAVLGTLLAVGPERIGNVTSDLFDAYVRAQQIMLEATGNITSDGRSEFAVLLHDASHADLFREMVATMESVRYERDADLEGWVIVTTEPGNRAGLDDLLAMSETRLVVPNRGVWICH